MSCWQQRFFSYLTSCGSLEKNLNWKWEQKNSRLFSFQKVSVKLVNIYEHELLVYCESFTLFLTLQTVKLNWISKKVSKKYVEWMESSNTWKHIINHKLFTMFYVLVWYTDIAYSFKNQVISYFPQLTLYRKLHIWSY